MDGALDPGRSKMGFALGERELVFSAVLPADRDDLLTEALRTGDFRPLAPYAREGAPPVLEGGWDGSLFVGDGTGSRELKAALEGAGFSCRLVEERDSTLLARAVYFRLHPPRGWRRLLPLSLLTPPRPVDDLAAWVLLLRGRGEDA
ncbi:conserved hypothetical protein [Aminomonas paucivorans DSM 12260]|uniref:Uncharacterized protein n=1 Tax=Aminomonas paucivorans DSM 12260 TaxID=584708 RepID=E3CZG1_9BACT|nr:hypothetical protein [Aminomonas paucivorans]EFQ22853.1 conserved hypothetical protein [Aminomonas paucivorans DSM 12260]